jgi:hypothetical protein
VTYGIRLFVCCHRVHHVKQEHGVLMCVAPCIFVYDYNYLHQQMHNSTNDQLGRNM